MGEKVALSFSGGKDSCLALYQLQQQGIEVSCLLTTVWKKNYVTVAHDRDLKRIKEQAENIGIPAHFIETDFDTYSEDFVATIKEMKNTYNIIGIAFGDIYLEGHREWGEQVAEAADVKPFYPLWDVPENMLRKLCEFVELGFQAEIIKVDWERLPESWVGRKVDESFVTDVMLHNVCPMGESGEYHTHVSDGPIFKNN